LRTFSSAGALAAGAGAAAAGASSFLPQAAKASAITVRLKMYLDIWKISTERRFKESK
jgi:hypothetical protein